MKRLNVVLEAYIDNNFGDDLFVAIFSLRYPFCNFFLTGDPILIDALGLPNVFHVSSLSINDNTHYPFDLFLLIGGDMFPDGYLFDERKRLVDVFANANKPVYFVGNSFKKAVSNSTKEHLLSYCSRATRIIPRDTQSMLILDSYGLSNTSLGSDSAFILASAFEPLQLPNKEKVIGISLRKKHNVDLRQHEMYLRNIGEIANRFLDSSDNRKGKVKFLNFSKGSYDDSDESIRIINDFSLDKNSSITYTGDLHQFILEFNTCDYIVATRFHAVIFALLLNKPFIPFVYDEKTANLLNDIDYTGVSLTHLSGIQDYSAAFIQLLSGDMFFSKEKLNTLVEYASINFSELDAIVGQSRSLENFACLYSDQKYIPGKGSILNNYTELKDNRDYLETQLRNKDALLKQQELLLSELKEYNSDLEEAKQYFTSQLESQENIIIDLEKHVVLLEEAKHYFTSQIESKEGVIIELEKHVTQLEEAKHHFTSQIESKEDIIGRLEVAYIEVGSYSKELEAAKKYFQQLFERNEKIIETLTAKITEYESVVISMQQEIHYEKSLIRGAYEQNIFSYFEKRIRKSYLS